MLVGALLLFVAVLAGKVAYRFGAPALLLFLGVGMLFGLDFISYRSVDITQFIGMMSLCVILFTGGMDTSFREIRPIIGPGVVLATAGVVMTALVLAGFVWLIAPWLGLEMPFALALLLASTMSSTDSASVFSILRSKKQGLKEHLRPLLELESGSNDPMAYMLTILLIGVLSNTSEHVGLGMSVVAFVVQMVVGALSGYLVGRLAVWTINRIGLANHSLYVVLLLAFVFFSFAFTDLVGGNGYLAVYLSGLVIEERVPVVFTSAGDPKSRTAQLHEAGCKVAHVVSSSKFARKSEEAGVDAVVAEGFEAGGHNGREETSTMVLTPHVRRAVRIPLLVAGGIATGRGMLAAFALGAEGVQLGTRFALTRESSASEEFKRLCLSLEEGGTTLALKKLAPTRLVRNDFCRAVEEAESRGATAEELSALLGRGRPKRGIFEGDLSEGELEIGQAASLLRDLPPAGEVVRQIVREYDEALPTLGRLGPL